MKDKTPGRKRPRRKKIAPYSVRVSKEYPWKCLSALHKDLDHLLSLQDSKLLADITRNRDLSAYLELGDSWGPRRIDPGLSLAQFRAKYQLSQYLKKYPFDGNAEIARINALKKFEASEKRCYAFNHYGFNLLTQNRDTFVSYAFDYAKGFIRQVIGDAPDLPGMVEWMRHGPGASIGTHSGWNSSFHKFDSWPYACSSRALGYGFAVIKGDKRWLGALEDDYRTRNSIRPEIILDQRTFRHNVLSSCDCNKIAFVPKSVDTDRTIAVEPLINIYLQLGVDGFIRRRLKRWDIDLDSQEKNQYMAKLGSMSGDYATLDLSAASDTISVAVVRELLPTSWYDLLFSLRSPFGKLPSGDLISYEKFSSMGNGYTFVLETLIFASLIYGVNRVIGGYDFRSDFAFYGDDLIVPSALSDHVVEILGFAGFKLNLDKSFSFGPFRESCGKDWLNGSLVRPIYLRNIPKDVTNLFNDFNQLKRVLHTFYGVCESESCALRYIASGIPNKLSWLIGPYSDEEFSTYRHSDKPIGKAYRGGMWRFTRLVKRPIVTEPKKFLFRKLMARLLPAYDTKYSRSLDSGSVFTAAASNRTRCVFTSSAASYWQSEYRA